MTDAELCIANGWVVGDVLTGTDGDVTESIRITAIGKQWVLAERLTCNGEDAPTDEANWCLQTRTWSK